MFIYQKQPKAIWPMIGPMSPLTNAVAVTFSKTAATLRMSHTNGIGQRKTTVTTEMHIHEENLQSMQASKSTTILFMDY